MTDEAGVHSRLRHRRRFYCGTASAGPVQLQSLTKRLGQSFSMTQVGWWTSIQTSFFADAGFFYFFPRFSNLPQSFRWSPLSADQVSLTQIFSNGNCFLVSHQSHMFSILPSPPASFHLLFFAHWPDFLQLSPREQFRSPPPPCFYSEFHSSQLVLYEWLQMVQILFVKWLWHIIGNLLSLWWFYGDLGD